MITPIEKLKLDFKWTLASRSPISMLVISFLINDLLYPFLVYSIYQKYQIPGWTITQILFIYGVSLIIIGVFSMLLEGFRWDIRRALTSGEFDYLLIRPKGVLTQNGLALFPPALGDILIGIAIMVLYNPKGNILNLVLLTFAGIAFLEAITILITALTINKIGFREFDVIFAFSESGQWPIEIYPNWFRKLIIFFPFVLVGFAPAYAYMNNELGIYAISATISIVLFIISLLALKISLKFYQSAGG